ncbi:MAG: hydrogenase [Spirochaetes bacterium GWD1_61_31]|nr:MAG: hydrogenase [Spirochaetes bacterium GWB1_60_80]OHD34567.1 MAG: hydrogenase [Spirochaetes bacterium GWC1_61_12]OHD44010.1 MAG: hydrogenase [Spirochaetes bacterium GWD1_61_31]OHD46178.1 MAG: hydrogenase [Spirochaetes bacterium GWE1_60_18]OHD60716.1 MAG: hydrogenase [Spirochaetes bacterium GWF1_60_12]HAP43895.1 hydrogenase [Spirochaetaceae bacterium]
MAFAMILVPLLFAGFAALWPSNRWRPWVLPAGAVVYAVLAALVLVQPATNPAPEAWLALDALGRLMLLAVSTLFLFCSFYAVGYLKERASLNNRVFVSCFMAFAAVLSLVVWARHLGLLWVAIEAITLVSAPLIYFKKDKQSIEATWKYLLVGSVGIALALFGTFFLAYSRLAVAGEASLMLGELLANAASLSRPWLRAAFILLLVGYGTKIGLAPMHTWKPDAYGEAPGVVGALFAGGVTSCAFLAFLRVYQICVAAGETVFVSRLLLFMGLFSMLVAGLFMIGQRDFKRLLAYSSVEHMGILMIGLGIGGGALFGAMLHVVTNGLTKGVLFLTAGNIDRAYGSKNTENVRGALKRLPVSAGLFLAGFLAITGSPPFGPFVSEFTILTGAVQSGRWLTAGLYLLLLLLVFIGMGKTVLKVTQGEVPPDLGPGRPRERLLTLLPAIGFLALSLLLGLYIPPPLGGLLRAAARLLEHPL